MSTIKKIINLDNYIKMLDKGKTPPKPTDEIQAGWFKAGYHEGLKNACKYFLGNITIEDIMKERE